MQLTEQEENANTVIAKWQESCNSLEEKNAQLLSALESCGVGEEGVIGQEALVALQERLRVIEGELARAREDMKEDDDAVLRWQGTSFPIDSFTMECWPKDASLTTKVFRRFHQQSGWHNSKQLERNSQRS